MGIALRIAFAVALGGGIGLAVAMVGRSVGGTCPLACNPYVSTGLGVFVALVFAARSRPAEELVRSSRVVRAVNEAAYLEVVPAPATLVTFYTQHCPACHKQLSAIDDLAEHFAGQATVAVVDADQVREAAKREGVDAVPTTVIYSRGERVEKRVGYAPTRELRRLLGRALESAHAEPETN